MSELETHSNHDAGDSLKSNSTPNSSENVKVKTSTKSSFPENYQDLTAARMLAHDLKSPLQTINSILKMTSQDLSRFSDLKLSKIDNEALILAVVRMNELIGFNLKNKRGFKFEILLLVRELQECYKKQKNNVEIEIADYIFQDVYTSLPDFELKKILAALIHNSVEAGADHIVVGICSMAIVVRDNGKGFPDIFIDSFGVSPFTFGKTQSAQSGTGLGLYNAKQTLLKYGGDLKLSPYTRSCSDTIITISLPK